MIDFPFCSTIRPQPQLVASGHYHKGTFEFDYKTNCGSSEWWLLERNRSAFEECMDKIGAASITGEAQMLEGKVFGKDGKVYRRRWMALPCENGDVAFKSYCLPDETETVPKCA